MPWQNGTHPCSLARGRLGAYGHRCSGFTKISSNPEFCGSLLGCQFSLKQVLKGGTNEISYSLVCLLFVLLLTFVVSSTRNQYSSMEVYQLENYHFSSLQKKFAHFALWDILLVT